VAVRIRMKQMGRAHRPFYRICAIDKRAPRDGKVLEELGTYDPMVPDTDARVRLKAERVDYWLSVGALPSEKCAVLIKKYGTNGTHASQAQTAQEKLAQPKAVPPAGPPVSSERPSAEEAPAAEVTQPTETEAVAEVAEEAAPAEETAPAEKSAPAEQGSATE
jgi:small subunit ribosomal protein S16